MTGKRRRLGFPGFRDITGNRAMWTDFLEVIRTGREPVMTTARAQRGLEIVEQAYATAAGGASASSKTDPLSSRAERGI